MIPVREGVFRLMSLESWYLIVEDRSSQKNNRSLRVLRWGEKDKAMMQQAEPYAENQC